MERVLGLDLWVLVMNFVSEFFCFVLREKLGYEFMGCLVSDFCLMLSFVNVLFLSVGLIRFLLNLSWW